MSERLSAVSYLEFLSESFAKLAKKHKTDFSVSDLVEQSGEFEISVLAGHQGLNRKLTSVKMQKPGLALAGYLDYLEKGRVQLLGRAEIEFMSRQSTEKLREVLTPIFESDVTCFLITRHLKTPNVLRELADTYGVPLLTSPKKGSALVSWLLKTLELELAPSITFHGTLVSVLGVGVLLIGKSGMGKSECALDLIMHGHQLVTDDMVKVRKTPSGRLIGSGDALIRNYLDIRGLGIINVKDLFSISRVQDEQTVDIGVYLEPWNPDNTYDCLGLDIEKIEILGVTRPVIRLPVSPGRNLANLIEVAVRNHLMKVKGYNAAEEVTNKLRDRMEASQKSIVNKH